MADVEADPKGDATGATGDVSMSMAGDATGKRMIELEETSSASSSIGK